MNNFNRSAILVKKLFRMKNIIFSWTVSFYFFLIGLGLGLFVSWILLCTCTVYGLNDIKVNLGPWIILINTLHFYHILHMDPSNPKHWIFKTLACVLTLTHINSYCLLGITDNVQFVCSCFLSKRSWVKQNVSDLRMDVKRIHDAQKLLINMWLQPPAVWTHADTHAHTYLRLRAMHFCLSRSCPWRKRKKEKCVVPCELGCCTLNSAKKHQVTSNCCHIALSVFSWLQQLMPKNSKDQPNTSYRLD